MYILVILPTYENFSMKLTSAECTVENSWWWAKKISASGWLFKKKSITMQHGNMNVK
jgi:hypothetical protein